jgi:hypothetical protein
MYTSPPSLLSISRRTIPDYTIVYYRAAKKIVRRGLIFMSSKRSLKRRNLSGFNMIPDTARTDKLHVY